MSSTSPARPVRVLLACDHIDYDGALHGGGRQLIELTRALMASTTVDPTVCVMRRPSALGRELVSEGLPFVFLGDPPLSLLSLPKLVRLIRSCDVDVLHLTDYGASTFGRLAAWITGRPAIVQVISHHSRHQRKGFPRHVELAYRTMAPLTAKALAISNSVKSFAVARMGFSPGDVEVLPYPLPKYSWTEPSAAEVASVRGRFEIAPDAAIVGAVTRFYPSKGIEYLLRAMPAVLREFPNTVLLLCGQGPQEEALRALAVELGIDGAVIFAGFQRRAEPFVAACAVAVTPSIEEGFGLVALEAQALGVPVVATRVGGLPDIVRDGRTGLLVDPADPAGLSAAITRILGDSRLRRAMSDDAGREAQRFSLDGYAARLSEIYRELATNGADRRRRRRRRVAA